MAGEIAVSVVGNITDEPELHFTPAGRAVVSFTVASTERRNKGGRWEDAGTTFLRVSAWGTLAQNVAESVAKGDRVLVAGILRQRTYENGDGDKRSVFEVTADEVGPSLKWASATVVRTTRAGSAAAPADPVLTEQEQAEVASMQQRRGRKTA